MANTSIAPPSYLKVICEGCIKESNPECPLCRGTRFYLWDPHSSFCYTENGEQIFFQDENGDRYPVTRRRNYKWPDILSGVTSDTMLKYIELWVSETPVRKWKLLLDENGWQSCVWFNRYKASCVQVTEPDFSRCIERTYDEIQKLRLGDECP